MQFNVTRVDTATRFKEKKSITQLLSLYNEPPQEELTLDEFERVALDRLQLLRAIEILNTRGFLGDEFKAQLKPVSIKLQSSLKSHHCPISSFERN